MKNKKRSPVGNRPHHDAATLQLMALVEARDFVRVEPAARQLLANNATHPLGLRALSFALIGQRAFDSALDVSTFALRHYPDDADIRNNRAIALAELMRWREAIAEFQITLTHSPNDCELHYNLGTAHMRLREYDAAVGCFVKAIERHPGDYVDAIEALGDALIILRRFDEAASVCQTVLDEFPDVPRVLERVIHVALYRSNWAGIDALLTRLLQRLRSDGVSATPWGFFKYWGASMADMRLVAERFARFRVPESVIQSMSPMPCLWREGERRLRVAYLSSDLGEHPVGFVMPEVFERHDRAQFELFAYATGTHEPSAQRQRLRAAFDHFNEVSELSINALQERIRADQIDVLIDLNGWTADTRSEALALRCAPVQVSWVGYAGTLGLPGLADYLLGDACVTPHSDQAQFSEQLVHLPDCFLPVDSTQTLAETPARQTLGLPADAFVLCSFNDAYKINPPLFDLWCDILRRLPDAVLWLRACLPSSIDNLRREAELRGIDPARVIFAERIDGRAAYLARIHAADIALDTFPYNSHSTGMDALYAGVPLVTCRGDTFPARVGESLLRAAHLAELVADDAAHYADIVVSLHADRVRLQALRAHLHAGRSGGDTLPLFDTQTLVQALENQLKLMANKAAVSAY
jgi:protein O-GlcNAc transferase